MMSRPIAGRCSADNRMTFVVLGMTWGWINGQRCLGGRLLAGARIVTRFFSVTIHVSPYSETKNHDATKARRRKYGFPEKTFNTEVQSAQRKKRVRFGEVFLCELPLFFSVSSVSQW